MTTRNFAQQIENLLLSGIIEGHEVLRLYYLLKEYEQETVSAEVMQKAIDQHDPNYVQGWLEDNLPPLFDD